MIKNKGSVSPLLTLATQVSKSAPTPELLGDIRPEPGISNDRDKMVLMFENIPLQLWQSTSANFYRINRRRVVSDSSYHILPFVLNMDDRKYNLEFFHRKLSKPVPGAVLSEVMLKLLVYVGDEPNNREDFILTVLDSGDIAKVQVESWGEGSNAICGMAFLRELSKAQGLLEVQG